MHLEVFRIPKQLIILSLRYNKRSKTLQLSQKSKSFKCQQTITKRVSFIYKWKDGWYLCIKKFRKRISSLRFNILKLRGVWNVGWDFSFYYRCKYPFMCRDTPLSRPSLTNFFFDWHIGIKERPWFSDKTRIDLGSITTIKGTPLRQENCFQCITLSLFPMTIHVHFRVSKTFTDSLVKWDTSVRLLYF